MYKLFDDFILSSICEYNNINDTICFLKSNMIFYRVLIKFRNKFKYHFINDNQLCIKCLKPCNNYSVILLCDNHKKYPTYHDACYGRITKKNFQIDKCNYCKENIFAIRIKNCKLFLNR